MGLGVVAFILSVALTTLSKKVDAEPCYYCRECGDDGYEADYKCMLSSDVFECRGGCYTELFCKADGSGDVCVHKDCIEEIDNPVCLRRKEFFPVVWAGPEESDDCLVTECCKGAECNDYSGDRLQDTLEACCPDCKKVCDCRDLMPANNPAIQSNLDSGPEILDCTTDQRQGIIPQNAIWVDAYSYRWTDATIPYDLVGFDATQTAAIMDGINTLNAQTCLNLIPRTTQTNYVQVFNGGGCYSDVGMHGGAQNISLHDSAAGTCLTIGTVMHEFLHATGFFHEHTRPDRDNFVCVNFTNIEADTLENFVIVSSADTLETAYTFGSVMHYRADNFDIHDGYLTLYPISCDPTELAEFGQRTHLHAVDIERVAKLYAGLGACPP